MPDQTALDLRLPPAAIRDRHDVALLCEHLGLAIVDELTTESWQRWQDSEQRVTVQLDAGDRGPYQIHVGRPGGWFVIFCYRGSELPTRCVRTAIEDALADGQTRRRAAVAEEVGSVPR